MDLHIGDIPETEAEPGELEDVSQRDLMIMVLREQRVTHRLVEALVRLLVPNEQPPEGPTLDQLLLALMGQMRSLIGSVDEVHETLVLHEEIIPANTVKALRMMQPSGETI